MKNKSKFSIGKLFIIVGILLIVVGVGYEAVNYPWRTLFGNTVEAGEMKEPKALTIPHESDYPEQFSADDIASLPAENSNLPLSRPVVDLTLLGSIKIPRIDLSENIVEGVGDEILYAVGHAPNSALPGEDGNTVLAGHRNYVYMHPFKHLPKMEIGDTVQIETKDAIFTYEVFDVFNVLPDAIWVMAPQEGQEKMLTLITCTPVPSYAERLIVWAKLTEEQPKTGVEQ